jgi:hypothetical protein
MSDEKISLDLLGARVLTLTAEVRDLQHRFTAMESRFTAMEVRLSAMEQRFAVQEERMSAMLAWLCELQSGSTGEVDDPQENVADHAALTRSPGARSSAYRVAATVGLVASG